MRSRRTPKTRSETAASGGGRRFDRRDHGPERVAKREQAIFLHDFSLLRFDVESIERNAAFRVDAREGNIEAAIGNRLHQLVEEADLIVGLNLDDDALKRE